MVDFALSPLTNAELEEGYILACQAKVRSDLEVDVDIIDHEVIEPRMLPGVISFWKQLPGDVIDMRVQLEEPLIFQAGQYTSIATSGSFVRRMFSYYDQPLKSGNHEVGFLIKRLPGGKFSQWLYDEDRQGVRLWLEGPFGQMGLEASEEDAICIAGGTGIAPILSVVNDRLEKFPEASITIVFGVRQEEDLFALDKLSSIEARAKGRVKVIPVLSHESEGSPWQGRRGLVTAVLTPTLISSYSDVAAFICGSVPMVNAVEAHLLMLGVPKDRIHADKFEPATS